MAVFIPETLFNLSNTVRRKASKALKNLSGDYLVRMPAKQEVWPCHLLIESKSGEALSVHFVEDKSDILSTIKVIKQQLLPLRDNCSVDAGEDIKLPVLFVIWNGKSDKIIQPDKTDKTIFMTGREYFLENPGMCIKHCSEDNTQACQRWLRKIVAPTSEIPRQCTTRTLINRDNSAKLNHFFLDYDQELAAGLDLFQPSSATEVGD